LFAGLESIRLGHGGDTLLGDFPGLDVHTVARGRQQLLGDPGRSSPSGCGWHQLRCLQRNQLFAV
jgi:hypothetical protein